MFLFDKNQYKILGQVSVSKKIKTTTTKKKHRDAETEAAERKSAFTHAVLMFPPVKILFMTVSEIYQTHLKRWKIFSTV